MELKELLGVKSQKTIPTVGVQEGKRQKETYQQWGHRMAGLNAGNIASLDPHLQIVYQNIRREQETDAALQQQLQNDIQQKIAREQQTLSCEESTLQQIKQRLQDIKDKIDGVNDEINKLKSEIKRKNSEAKANFIIGLIIIIPLTIYLFIFYSSTAYSAFFKEIDYTQALGSHMFDAQALTASWQQSWTAGLFVLLITFIFMALGFILHQFTKQKGSAKYMKVSSIIIVTFVFDTLLAYLIAKNMYDAEALTKLGDIPSYTLSMAFIDARFWIVIFCGFLAYIIWGILFGFVMDNYNNLDLNKVEREKLERQLERLLQQEKTEQNNIAAQNAKIATIRGNIAALETQKTDAVRLDYNAILLELNHFFAGWMAYMNGAAMDYDELQRAQTVFNAFVAPIQDKKTNKE